MGAGPARRRRTHTHAHTCDFGQQGPGAGDGASLWRHWGCDAGVHGHEVAVDLGFLHAENCQKCEGAGKRVPQSAIPPRAPADPHISFSAQHMGVDDARVGTRAAKSDGACGRGGEGQRVAVWNFGPTHTRTCRPSQVTPTSRTPFTLTRMRTTSPGKYSSRSTVSVADIWMAASGERWPVVASDSPVVFKPFRSGPTRSATSGAD